MINIDIEQNSNIEVVTAGLLKKLYDIILSNDILTCILKGNLLSQHCLDYVYNYLTNNFPELTINITKGLYLNFLDSAITNLLVRYIGNGEGVTLSDIQAFVISGKDFGASYTNTHTNTANKFILDDNEKSAITSFNEFALFSGVTKLDHDTFKGATNLESLTLPDTIINLENNSLLNCSSLTSIDLSNIEEIGMEAFRNSGITGVVNLPSLVKFNSRYIFAGCSNMTEIHIGLNFNGELGGGGQFYNCTSLLTATGLSEITQIFGYTFYGDAQLSSVDLDWSKITRIALHAFDGCLNLVINDLSCPLADGIDALNVSYIGLDEYAFHNCKKLKKVSNLGTITKIPNYCFLGCSDLTSITLPLTFTGVLGVNVFTDCTSLTTINNLGTNIYIPITGERMFRNCSNLIFPLIITITSLEPTDSNSLYWLKETFLNCSNLNEVILDSSVKGIAKEAFKNSTLTALTAPGVEYIGDNCFENCINLAEVNLPAAVGISNQSNGHLYFRNCTYLTKVVLGKWDTLPSVNANMGWFTGTTTNLNTFDIGDVVTEIQIDKRGGVFTKTYSLLLKFIIRNTVVPTLTKLEDPDTEYTEQQIINCFGGSQVKIYVPDLVLNDYKTANIWSLIASYIYPLSDIEPTT